MEKIEQKDIEGKGGLPEINFRAGVISATVWQNQGKNRDGEATEYKTVSVQRGYKTKNGEWQNTTSLRINDLPRVNVVLQKAYEYLILSKGEGKYDSNTAI